VAATNCLNFGNPEKPEIMAQLSAAIDGIEEACTALGTPVTGGNVSLYNETKGEGIYPTPVIGVVGILDDVTKAVPNSFQAVGHHIFLVALSRTLNSTEIIQEFGSTEYAKGILHNRWGVPPSLDIPSTARLHDRLVEAIGQQLVVSASDISDGGLAIALAKASFEKKIGADVMLNFALHPTDLLPISYLLFGESPALLLTCLPQHNEALMKHFADFEVHHIGLTEADSLSFVSQSKHVIGSKLSDLWTHYSVALESQLAAEVLA